MHLLQHGLARAYVVGSPARFETAIIENLVFNRDELTGFGTAGPLWELLRGLHGWSCIEVDSSIAAELGGLLAAGTERPVRFLDGIYCVLQRPVAPICADQVRLLNPIDIDLLVRAPPGLRGEGWESTQALLRNGIAAAAVIDSEIVALAHTSARSNRHADLGVATIPAWRGRGLASAAAALVARNIQATGQMPVWSTGVTNTASLRIADKLGFVQLARRTYLIQ